MSSRESAVISLELPTRTVAAKLATAASLCGTGALVGVVLGAGQYGIAVALAVMLTCAAWLASRRVAPTAAVRLAELRADGTWRLTLFDGRREIGRTRRSSRVLGSAVVLDLGMASGENRRFWLTSADVPRDTLRRLAVRLLATGQGARQ